MKTLLKQIADKRQDPLFRARRERLLREHQEVLKRLAKDD
jgi:hypothetical protein